jgi:hypothetical protein
MGCQFFPATSLISPRVLHDVQKNLRPRFNETPKDEKYCHLKSVRRGMPNAGVRRNVNDRLTRRCVFYFGVIKLGALLIIFITQWRFLFFLFTPFFHHSSSAPYARSRNPKHAPNVFPNSSPSLHESYPSTRRAQQAPHAKTQTWRTAGDRYARSRPSELVREVTKVP